MNAFTIVAVSGIVLWLGYRFYGRLVARRAFGAGSLPDEHVPSRLLQDGVDFVPTKRHVLLGHHYVTIAGAGPIVGPAVAVTWGWLPALLWVVLGSIFIGAVHDFGTLIASIRNRGRTIGDLAADILTPRVRLLFLAFIFMALWVVLAVFAFVIAGLFASRAESVFAIWFEVPLAMAVSYFVYRRGGSMVRWSLLALLGMYVAIWVGSQDAVTGLFEGWGIPVWLGILFVYSYCASVLPVTKLLQPRDYINSHQLFFALGILGLGLIAAFIGGGGSTELVAPAINSQAPAKAPSLYPFLFITIACGAISGFHCMVASGTTARQLQSERDAHPIGYGSMILEGGLAVVVVVCCVSAAGLGTESAWHAKYSGAWVGGTGLIARIQGFIDGGAAYMGEALSVVGVTGIGAFLTTVLTVVIISFAATTMDSATRIQRYVVAELGSAVKQPWLGRKHVATFVAVSTAAALALLAGNKGLGSGGLVLWPIFGVVNQLLACLTFLVLTTWLAKRGRPVIFTALPMMFLIVTVSWAGVEKFADSFKAGQIHLMVVLGVGLALEAWMLFECLTAFKITREVRAAQAAQRLTEEEAQRAMAGPTGALIDADGVIHAGAGATGMPEGTVC